MLEKILRVCYYFYMDNIKYVTFNGENFNINSLDLQLEYELE